MRYYLLKVNFTVQRLMKNIFKSGELVEDSVTEKTRQLLQMARTT